VSLNRGNEDDEEKEEEKKPLEKKEKADLHFKSIKINFHLQQPKKLK
jgi:hypothetical protein